MADEQTATIPATHLDILQSTAVAVVSTLGPHGEPQSSPVWFGWDGHKLRFSHTKARQKYRNLLRDPRIAVTIMDPANPYRYIEIRGTSILEDDPQKLFIDTMAKKYTGADRYPNSPPSEQRVVIIVTPTHVNTMG
jgi:PPOX class probable F420-dependent enzyme